MDIRKMKNTSIGGTDTGHFLTIGEAVEHSAEQNAREDEYRRTGQYESGGGMMMSDEEWRRQMVAECRIDNEYICAGSATVVARDQSWDDGDGDKDMYGR